jgi:FkbM family methyltransferase
VKLFRQLFYKIFGLQFYLSFVSRIYLLLVKNGFLKNKYPELFFLKEIIKPGFYCIDIGANLGYYSTFLSKYTGEIGKVFAVEPVPLFQDVWSKNIKMSGFNNLQLFPVALGAEDKPIQLSMPVVGGVIHHGMTKISGTSNEEVAEVFDAQMRIADQLFINLERLDFIKCDVEGYEFLVLGNMTKTLDKYKPLVQCELGGNENRQKVINLFEGLGYNTYILKNNQLFLSSTYEKQSWQKDFYFKFNK